MNFTNIKPTIPNPDLFDKYSIVNRLIIIGNGFDLAHDINSSFKDFIFSYAQQLLISLYQNTFFNDELVSIELDGLFLSNEHIVHHLTGDEAFERLNELISRKRKSTSLRISSFFTAIIKEIETKNWVDIENQYFEHLIKISNDENKVKSLNIEFDYLKNKFLDYLKEEIMSKEIRCSEKLKNQFLSKVQSKEAEINTLQSDRFPNRFCILNFNYTSIIQEYLQNNENTPMAYVPIHGEINGDDVHSQKPIFGYGDEIDEEYLKLERLKSDEVFKHIKSFKYLQFGHYRNLIDFISLGPFQVQIYGHSCGLSDRTLLNTIFENDNCISIKPFYHEKSGVDNYEELTIAISRHFNSKTKLRNRVVNKDFCEPMEQPFKE
jgi:hypothetical protein